MTKNQMIAMIQELERRAWESYNTAKELADMRRYGNVAKDIEKQSRTRWATLYELMQDLEVGPKA
ncbi:MAG: hypothetical protein EBS31_08215 [Burkholderiaceae bacterium]|nr:hypothetical protein [Burkholderiaceae bacterium]